jgi:hypothetical protein
MLQEKVECAQVLRRPPNDAQPKAYNMRSEQR